ncbi:DNA polymerase family A-domain-containing protein [Hypoxylon rubiginosum]|uniref:DNA polymerase family A-domain-containing protein n=1 Tax=Hypoxylon rubiginosum TaxID=110542 RepID=A0ACB9YJR5_9PEZI|nr:DNA polymerase family A-domain-containing protein [Hypoxylon rubiginosum]
MLQSQNQDKNLPDRNDFQKTTVMLHPANGRMRSASTAGFVRLAKHPLPIRSPCQPWLSHLRWQTSAAATVAVAEALNKPPPRVLPGSLATRFSEIGVQHVSAHVFKQIFPKGSEPPPKELVELSKDHLRRHDLYGKNTDNNAPIAFDVPPLQGQTLDEHFHRLGVDCAEPFLSYAKEFARHNPLPRPRKWVKQSGWTKYYPDGRTERLDSPDEKMLCFDVEVMWKESSFAVMACATSPTAWYAWLSPWLLGESKSDRHLIPLGDPTKDRIIVGHNIGYDRARVLEEYDLKQSRNSFLDTMSLHVAVNGMCSQQRPKWMKHKKNRELRDKIATETDNVELANLLASNREEEEELWVEHSSINSLRDVAKFHLNVTIDKAARDQFGELDREGVLGKLDELLDYCAADVAVTHRVYQAVFPNFLEVCPHPVSFAALRHLSSVILPVNKSWDAYIANAEATYHKLSGDVQQRLVSLAEKAIEIKDNAEKWGNDPWLKQLDWSGQEIKMVKGKKKNDPPRPAARQKKPGMPKWYKNLFQKNDAPISLTVRTRIAPLLLRLAWDGYPLVWSDKYGWIFKVPLSDMSKYSSSQLVRCDLSDETVEALKNDLDGLYFKLPHKDGPTSRCVNPLAKGYLSYFDKGTLSSEYPLAKEALDMNASCSYWISARDRIMSQMVVYEKDKVGNGKRSRRKNDNELGYILPQVIPMGTITRRAVENTWLTASNAKKNRVGSELKAMVKAPPGYCLVGADVDSEELWIASVVGDATFKLHGGNAIGFMTLEGTKAAGTDLHSRTASILSITRNDAKVFNYGRIYGAGLKFAATLLRQFNPNLSEQETLETASKLYATTKGTKTTRKTLHKKPFWRGGTESFVFNKLEEFAEQERPRTPVLAAGITEALMGRFINKGGYLTSRINWAIQSSGVDYLHLLIVSMDYLTRRYNIAARLAISVHDEIRYLVKDEDKYRAAMALQVANLWTRAMFAQQVGIDDLPQSCAYFSAIDIDHVLRKEVDMDCVTPSHSTPISPGESLDITQLLAKGDEAYLNPAIIPAQYAPRLRDIPYTARTPVMQELNASRDAKDLSFLKAQITNDEKELRDILKDQKKTSTSSSSSGGGSTTGGAARKPRQSSKLVPYSSQAQLPHMYEPFEAKFPSRQEFNRGSGGGGQWTFESMPSRPWRGGALPKF